MTRFFCFIGGTERGNARGRILSEMETIQYILRYQLFLTCVNQKERSHPNERENEKWDTPVYFVIILVAYSSSYFLIRDTESRIL